MEFSEALLMGIIVISVETAVADIRRVISTQDLNMANIIFLSKELDELNFIFITPPVYIMCVHHIKEDSSLQYPFWLIFLSNNTNNYL